jgi:dihydrofolate reductase
MIMSRKLILYISMSLDGYIATKDNSLEFLSIVEQDGEDYGYNEFIKSVDTVIIGRKTYEKVLEMGYEYPHTNKNVYIITRTERDSIGNFKFYTGELPQLINELKNQIGNNIYCDGGAEIACELIKNDLIDEYIISIIPILLGDGIKLFKENCSKHLLEIVSVKKFTKGLVQLHYKRAK